MRRRTLLRRTGVSLGGLTLAATGVAAASESGSRRRFVVDRESLRDEDSVDVVHALDPVDLLVVRASEAQLEDAGADFAPDVRIDSDPYGPVRRSETVSAAEAEDLSKYQWDKRDQRISETHEITRGDGSRVAIIDSGIAAGHPALEGRVNLERSKSFANDDYGVGGPYGGTHGTHVAGIVAADDTERGVVGSAPDAELVDLRVFGASPESASAGTDGGDLPPDYWGETYYGSVMAALVYATEIGCDAANLSLGWTWRMRSDGWGKFWGEVHQRVGNYARRNGTIHAHASGNWGESLQFNEDETDSSQTAGGLTTSSTGPVGFDPETGDADEPAYSPSTYTTHGVGAIDLAAPGGNGGEYRTDDVLNAVAIPQFDEETGEYRGAEYGYDWLAGTSMAAPQVTGAVALVNSAASSLNGNQVRNVLQRTADRPDEYENKYYGAGYLDTYAAVTESG
ncbi:S8 family peptidase [Natrinema salifodinae]|uniref:Subtilase family protein n=1 Tax=Natrinema salifodinae TaxID=1202768 RepID=A0A1I0QC05_9EURY|nr:S8 family serine peptidase [Natrinema salifodinae]SEW24517.1 Subtilase family protein [Natrinema salifodinae]